MKTLILWPIYDTPCSQLFSFPKGQINHILPLAFAVLTANFVAKALDLNIFDSIIRIKKLPYLPDISTSDHTAFNIFVDDFMVKDVKFMSYTDSR